MVNMKGKSSTLFFDIAKNKWTTMLVEPGMQFGMCSLVALWSKLGKM